MILHSNKSTRCFTALLLCIFFSSALYAQKDSVEKVFAFKITGYINVLTDSSIAVQVMKPAAFPVSIKNKQLGVLYHCYKAGEALDTAAIGVGRCNLIKGDYYYFGIKLHKQQKASEGDLIYLKVKMPYVYDGLLLNVMNHAINFTNVYGDNFMNTGAVFTNTKNDEFKVLDSMVNDIHFTGSAMLQQMPGQNQPVKGGIYDGKKLFEAMQAVKRTELEAFLKYVTARPKKYAGNSWKISEVFATWMDGGTPTVIEK
ncbi:MAG: hypothetical protein JNM14_00380 [Ferruginibacter sp.]|nr:hypothetical protein [Ferruginibacter sp.]